MSSVQICNYDFAIQLGKVLAGKNDSKNLFFSPASVSLAMAMCHRGTGGKTEQEIKNVFFGSESTAEQIRQWVQKTLSLEGEHENRGTAIKFANRLYTAQRYQLREEYVQGVVEDFKAKAIIADFEEDADQVADEINHWVEEVTNKKIRNLVPPGFLTPDVALLLINALYFKAPWYKNFAESATEKKNFQISPNENMDVDMMHMTDAKMWFDDEEVEILELTYAHVGASMIFVLPKERHGLKKILKDLNGEKFSKWLENMRREQVHIEIPKFKIEQSFKLNEPMKSLGIRNAFDFEASDFSGMVNDPKVQMKISEILHKAFIEVDEKGTEAAAANVIKIVAKCSIAMVDHRPPKRFIADQPFLFVLTAGRNEDRVILFLGQYYGKDAK